MSGWRGVRGAAAAGVLGVAVVAWGARLVNGGFVYSLWSDRDLVRAAEVATGFPTMGAELTGLDEGRTPGGAWALTLAPPVLASGEPAAAWRWLHLLHGLAAAVVAGVVARRHGALAAAAAAAALVLAPVGWEVRATLWNPTGLDLPSALTLAALAAAARGQRWAFAAAGVALGWATQVHASTLAWALPAAAMAAWLGGPRRLGLVGAGAALTWVPYVVADGLRGWPNTARLVAPAEGGGGGLGQGLARIVEVVWGMPAQLGYGEAPWLAAVQAAPWAVALAAAGWALWRPRERPEAAVAAAGLVVGLPLLAASFGAMLMPRYLEAVLPLMACLFGVAASRWAAPALLVVVVAPAWAMWPALARDPGRTPDRWPELGGLLGGLAANRGLDLAETAARTVFAQWTDEGVTWRPMHGVAWLLRREGLEEAGARPGPCTLILFGGPVDAGAPGAAEVEAAVGPGARVLTVTALEDRVWRVDWSRDGWCPSSFTNRYVDLAAEAPLRARFGDLRCGEADEVSPGRWLGALDLGTAPVCAPIGVDLTVAAGPSRLDVALVSAQLRGHAWFGGWFRNGRLWGAVVVGEGPGGRVEVRLGDVGWGLAPTPVEVSGPVAPGLWTLRLEAELQAVSSMGEPGGRRLVTLPLGTVIVPP